MPSTTQLKVGISTCPNDTFAFHALLERRVETGPLELEFELCDVQELNERMLAGEFDVVKASFAAALGATGDLIVLRSGSALGFGVGPVLLGAAQRRELDARARVLCPGAHTTATLLLRLFHPELPQPQQVVFSEIMPALANGTADYGVCIHEGRFTYAAQGLELIEDLGARWEADVRAPLPLGGIFARRALGAETIQQMQAALARSLRYATEQRSEALVSMRRYAQEFDDDVLWQHVELYVNEWTHDLGREGALALEQLSRRAQAAGLLAPETPALEICA